MAIGVRTPVTAVASRSRPCCRATATSPASGCRYRRLPARRGPRGGPNHRPVHHQGPRVPCRPLSGATWPDTVLRHVALMCGATPPPTAWRGGAFVTSVVGAATYALLYLAATGDVAPDWMLGLSAGSEAWRVATSTPVSSLHCPRPHCGSCQAPSLQASARSTRSGFCAERHGSALVAHGCHSADNTGFTGTGDVRDGVLFHEHLVLYREGDGPARQRA